MQDLQDAIDFIADSSPESAVATARRVWDRVQQLTAMPGLGRPGRVLGTRELVVPGTPLIIPYRVDEGAVQILRVLHS